MPLRACFFGETTDPELLNPYAMPVSEKAKAEILSAEMGTVSTGVDGKQRFKSLDSLRGLAALSVMFFHVMIASPALWSVYGSGAKDSPSWVKVVAFTPLHIFWDGQEAVMIFFALSGFVLMQAFLKAEAPSYREFVVRRICRIYPTCWIALLVSAAAMVLIGHRGASNLSAAFLSSWSARPRFTTLLFGYVLVLGGGHAELDGVIWSLFEEMRISLFFQRIARQVIQRSYRSVLGVWGCIYLVAASARHITGGLFAATLNYAFLFVCGAILAKHRQAVTVWFASISRRTKIALAITALALYNARWEVSRPARDSEIAWALVRLGAILILGLAVVSPSLEKWLAQPLLVWFGEISYSLYLIHVVVLTAILYAFNPILPRPLLAVAAVCISIACAAVLNLLVERPSIRLGRSLSNRVRYSPSTTVLVAQSANQAVYSAQMLAPNGNLRNVVGIASGMLRNMWK